MTDKRVRKWAALSGMARPENVGPENVGQQNVGQENVGQENVGQEGVRRVPGRRRTVLLALLLGLGWMMSAATWQPPELDGQEPAAEAPAETKPERAKPRGRLPAYYSRVVNAAQREEIYDIQGKFNEQIEQLQMQIDELISQRDAEVEKVLSADQLKQVATYVEEARVRREQRRQAEDSKTEAESAQAESAAKDEASDTP